VYLPQSDEVSGNLVLRHLDLGEIIHAKADEVEARDRRRDLIVRDFCVLGPSCEEAILRSVKQFVAAYFNVLATNDKNIEARESADCETRYGHAFDWLTNSLNTFVLADEVRQLKAAACYTHACLARCIVSGWVDWACKAGTFILDRGFRWGQGHSFADEGDAVCLDQELFGISARIDDDAAASECGVDCSLDRLASANANRLVVSFPSCGLRSA